MLERRRAGSLLDMLDVTRTAMGARLLRRWLLFPLRRPAAHPPPPRRGGTAGGPAVGARGRPQDPGRAGRHRAAGQPGPAGRGHAPRSGGAGPDAGAAAGAGRRRWRGPARICRSRRRARICCRWARDLCADVEARVVATLADDAPAATKDGGFVRAGFSAELDELRGAGRGRAGSHPGDRGARARAHRHRLAEGQVQQRLRLLHRDHPGAAGPAGRRPGGLHPQADGGQRRTLRHPRAVRTREPDRQRRRAAGGAGAGDVREAAARGGRGGGAAAGAGGARRHRRRAGGAGRGGPPPRLRPPDRSTSRS